ncbi:hypothetical protein FRC11_005001 [Ceratobasidium sp. 423]|nr:hypothetical protein FRC11_005001 [Ceratobasidium sp. 423]
MERLSRNGFPMTQLDVQRRMRPSISSLIRNTLYPKLQDNDQVLDYPDVRGMDKNIFFISHENLERGGGEDSVSKHNEFEVNLIYDLVAHLLRQGCYNDERNIVVLAAYLGQVPKIQQKLQSLVTTVVDDRDAAMLAEHGIEETQLATTREMDISKRVLVRSLDNFQGEEGDIIILSLVRNSGTRFKGEMSQLQFTGGRSPIGFLKSKNRTNVGLSRAKHGLYIFGNAPELARGSDMWAHILQELHIPGCVGRGFPVKCYNHPEYIQWIEQPGQLEAVAPDDWNARKTMIALRSVKNGANKSAPMELVALPVPFHAALVQSPVHGGVLIINARVRVVCRAHDSRVTCHVPESFHVDTIVHQIVGISEFYERSSTGQWSKPSLPGGARAQPTCPACNGLIDSLRYGRIIKNSRLASLQHHVAADLSHQLAETDTQLAIVREGLVEAIGECIQACASSQSLRGDQTNRVMRNTTGKLDAVLDKEPDRPTAPEFIEITDRFHAFPDNDAKAWKNTISRLMVSYRAARELTRIKDPLIQPYQEALAQLSREEAGRLRVLFSHQMPGGQNIEQYASHLARVAVGQFPPRSTHQCAIEAFWITGEILLLVGKATSAATCVVRENDANDPASVTPWERLAEFLLLRATKDCEKAHKIATRCEAWNKAIKCQVLSLQANYELALHKSRVAANQGLLSDPKTSKELEALCLKSMHEIQDQQIGVQQEYLKKWGSLQGSGRQEWIQETFVRPSNIILKYWEILKRSVGAKTQCKAEMETHELAILGSFLDQSRHARASSSDHFYQCSNGHTYAFTECIPINGRKTCPECGIWVEDISRQQSGGMSTHVARVPIPVLFSALASGAKHAPRPGVGSTITNRVDPEPSTVPTPNNSNIGGASSSFSPNRPGAADHKWGPSLRINNTWPPKPQGRVSNVTAPTNPTSATVWGVPTGGHPVEGPDSGSARGRGGGPARRGGRYYQRGGGNGAAGRGNGKDKGKGRSTK